MKIDEIMKLIDAGFTRDEIIALETPAEAPEEKPEEAPEEKPEEVKTPLPEEYASALNGILDSFKAVAKEIKAANILNSNMPEVPAKSAEDALWEAVK